MLTIEEAGDVRDNAGHVHVIADEGCVAPGEAVARDADHVHFVADGVLAVSDTCDVDLGG